MVINTKIMTLQMPAVNFNLITLKSNKDDNVIKNVWNHNLHEEFHVIRQVCDSPYFLK